MERLTERTDRLIEQLKNMSEQQKSEAAGLEGFDKGLCLGYSGGFKLAVMWLERALKKE